MRRELVIHENKMRTGIASRNGIHAFRMFAIADPTVNAATRPHPARASLAEMMSFGRLRSARWRNDTDPPPPARQSGQGPWPPDLPAFDPGHSSAACRRGSG